VEKRGIMIVCNKGWIWFGKKRKCGIMGGREMQMIN